MSASGTRSECRSARGENWHRTKPVEPRPLRTVDGGVDPVHFCLPTLGFSIGKGPRLSIGNYGEKWLAGLTGSMEIGYIAAVVTDDTPVLSLCITSGRVARKRDRGLLAIFFNPAAYRFHLLYPARIHPTD